MNLNNSRVEAENLKRDPFSNPVSLSAKCVEHGGHRDVGLLLAFTPYECVREERLISASHLTYLPGHKFFA